MENGSGAATATAGTKAGTAKIKAKGSYLSSASCNIKVKEAKSLRLSISASPDILPADGKSQTVLSIKVLNEEGNVATSYNGKVNLHSSNASALKVPNSISIKEGKGTAKATAGSSAAEVSVNADGDGLISASCKVKIIDVELQITSINANDPSAVIVNCVVIPETITLDSIRIQAPGVNSLKNNVTGSFTFTLNQNNVASAGNYKIKLLGKIGESSVKANCDINVNNFGTEKVCDGLGGVFWAEGMGLTRVTFRDYFVWYTEVSYSIPYLGKTFLLTGGVVQLDYTHFLINENPEYTHAHKYMHGSSVLCDKFMTTSNNAYPELKPHCTRTVSQYTKDSEWVLPEDLTGHAKCTSYIIGSDAGSIIATPMINANTEVKIK
jgi:hypothetical protein